MQDVLLKTCRYAATIRKPDEFDAWVYRTSRNACLMRSRRHAGEPEELLSIDPWGRVAGGREIGPPVTTCDQEVRLMRECVRARVGRSLRELDRSYRKVLLLRDVEGLSTKQAAAALGLSEANIKVRLHRARRLLRRGLPDLLRGWNPT